jgi:hypothetical protein
MQWPMQNGVKNFPEERTADVAEISGESVPRTAEDWSGYLVEYGKLYVQTANEYQRSILTAEQIETHWLGAEPADEQTIEATEQRLEVRFPPSLRAFLSVTNGWQGLGGYVDQANPCSEIDWLRNTVRGAELIEVYEAAQQDDELNELLALFRRVLLLGDGEDVWLLDPTATHPDGEWTAYQFQPSYGDYSDYSSFAELFQRSKEDMEEMLG